MTDTSSVRAFVVEDHSFQRSGLVSLLRAIGVRHLREAANGREALAMLESDPEHLPDVILCDLEMPVVDGIEFLRLVAQRKLAHSVVIISGREPEILASVEAMVRSLGLAVLGTLGKPVAPESLWEILSADHDRFRPAAGRVRAFNTMELKRGIEAGEFQCEFQPKVSLTTGQMTGVEALARWRRPGGLAVGPGEFVPAMVLAGLITPLTVRMLDAASRALREWDRQGLQLTAAVNVSMSTLADLDTADRFATQVRALGVEPRRITLEVTETEVMSDVANVLTVLARLRLKGFQLAIDDFGTGYASLAQLNAIPFTELKIDQTFVRNCGQSPRLRNIVRSAIELAHRLNMCSVAEGIESRDEWDFLRLSHCDHGQGHYVARPMPEDEIPDYASRSRRHLTDERSRPPPPGARS